MVKVKKMNENAFAKLHKELTAMGELVRARQEEKQSLLDEFDAESRRFFFGAISERSLASSVKKTNRELKRLDNDLRNAIRSTKAFASHAMSLAAAQKPVVYRATLSGLSGGDLKKANKPKKKSAKRKKKR